MASPCAYGMPAATVFDEDDVTGRSVDGLAMIRENSEGLPWRPTLTRTMSHEQQRRRSTMAADAGAARTRGIVSGRSGDRCPMGFGRG